MPKIKLSIPHTLGKDEARRRINDLIANSRESLATKISDLEQAWNGDAQSFRFRTMGFAVSGSLLVQPAEVLVEVDLPFAALPFKGRLEKEIRSRAVNLLT